MSINNLSSVNQQFIQQNSSTINQTPIYTVNTTQAPSQNGLVSTPVQDTFVKKNKKKIILGSILGAAVFLGGAFLLAKNGKLGEKAQGFVNSLFNGGTKLTNLKDGNSTVLNSKGKTFYNLKEIKNPDGTKGTKKIKVSALNLQNGVFTGKDGNPFNGIMEFKNKNGNLIQNLYKDGQLVQISKDGVLTRTIERSGRTTTILDYNEDGKISKGLKKIADSDYTQVLQSNILQQTEKHTLIPNDKSFVQINETGNVNGKKLITSHKIFDTKTKQVIQEGKLSFDTAIYGQKGAIVVQDGNKKYVLRAKANEAGELFPNIAQGKAGVASTVPSIEETLPNGVVKYYSSISKMNRESGFVFPNGEEIYYRGERATGADKLCYIERLTNGTGNITGESYSLKGDLTPVCETTYAILPSDDRMTRATLARVDNKSIGKAPSISTNRINTDLQNGKESIPLSDEEKETVIKFFKKFIPHDDKYEAVHKKYGSIITDEKQIREAVDEIKFDSKATAQYYISEIKTLLNFLEQYNI